MVFEKGGRADKQGNVYENRCLARVLLRLIAEEITSVVVEPIRENTDICEFYINEKNGKRVFYQCKGSNASKDHWNPSDLQKHSFYSRVQKLLFNNPDYEFRFISPLYYNGLDDLCNRAKNYSSAKDFLKYALSNQQLRNDFEAFEKYFGLSRDNETQLNELLSIISRCEFLVFPNNSEFVKDLNRWAGVYFYGDAGNALVLLENYVNDTSLYGKELTVSDVIKYLSEKGIKSRNLFLDDRINPIISRLNRSFSDSYNAIQGQLFHRDCTDMAIKAIENGESIILHGKAGVGKSGCIRELIENLENHGIDYLAIQLDKHIPSGYADKYGESLGLPGSPISCLSNICGTKPCVLILDQLDSLRWTSLHSSTALELCKELIEQARGINEHRGGKVSIVFSVRTFDYENDVGIKALFSSDKNESSWSVINVETFTEEELRQLIGDDFKTLPARIQDLIHIPSSLYVWLKLDAQKRKNQISSAQEMVRIWWKQIQDGYISTGQDQNALADFIDSFVSAIISTNSFALPCTMFLSHTRELEYMVSSGMLLQDGNSISFAHQSFLDSFLLEKDLYAFYGLKKSLLSIVLSWESQMPIYRYRLSALFQNIIEQDQNLFSKDGREFLESEKIHYYYKAAFFEAIGQLSNPSSAILKIIDDYFEKPDWRRLILQSVYERHPVFIKHLSTQKSFDWLSEEGVPLLVSMKYYSPDFVAQILQTEIDSKKTDIKKTYSILGTTIETEADILFNLRINIYTHNTMFLSEIHYIQLEKVQPNHIYQLFALILKNSETLSLKHIYIDEKKLPQFCTTNYIDIIHSLFSLLCISAKNTELSFHATIPFKERFWLPREPESSIARTIVEIVKTSLQILARNNPSAALDYATEAAKDNNAVANELALSTILELPLSHSDNAIEWLLSDFDHHILDCISNEYDYLSTTKDIIKKHASFCSYEVFTKLEDIICNWQGDRTYYVELYKRRVKINRTEGETPVYWPTWGHLQKNLLPFLDPSRTSKKTKDLLNVLNRNSWVLNNRYHAGILSGEARTVVSTIHQNATRLSDKTWLRIITANVENHHSKIREKDDGHYYCESSHKMFASDLETCVKNDPVRYAKLALAFPLTCYPGYFTSILIGIERIDPDIIDFDLLCQVIRYSKNISSDNIPVVISNIISARPKENWPEDIISFIIETATGKLKPIGDEKVFTSNADDSFPSPEDMELSALNCPRGMAIEAIYELLLNHTDLFETFKKPLRTLAQDESSIVRFALVKCAAVYFDYDSGFSTELFDTLLNKDLLVLCARLAFWLMRQDSFRLEKHYFEYLKKACESPNSKLVVCTGQLICTTAILTSSDAVCDFLYSHSWPKEALDKICIEAAYAFATEEYHSVGKAILEHFLEIDTSSLHSINYLFREKKIDIQRDFDFIVTILQKRGDLETANAFIDFIKDQDVDLSQFASIIKMAIDNVNDDAETWQKYRIEDGIIHAVIKLTDSAKENDEIMECCLEILDTIYQKRILTDSAISRLLDGTN